MMTTERAKYLIGLYLNRTISDYQALELSIWVAEHASDEQLANLLEDAWANYEAAVNMPEVASEKIITAVLKSSPHQDTPGNKARMFTFRNISFSLKRIAVAASVLLIISIGYFKLTRESAPIAKNNSKQISTHSNDIAPGGQKALLTLADGTQIDLDSASNGLLTQQGNTKVIKLANGQLQYNSNQSSSEILFNTMSTPVGGQYRLSLPDGSKVWLNAASSIHYPAAFSGKDRRVEITGEAYFEIAKNERQPFFVKINNGPEVKVLGTHFNIKAYTDEQEIKTTLLEGVINVSYGQKNKYLKPGDQAKIDKNGEMKLIANSNLEEAIAWKNGIFYFNHADLSTVLQQASRWYGFEVEYQGKVSAEDRFTGKIAMSVNFSRFIKWMEWSDVRIKVEGKKVVVSP
jgi:transmembrane sensor